MSIFRRNPNAVHHRTGSGAAVNPDSIGMFRAVSIGVFITFFAQVAVSAKDLYLVGLELEMGDLWSIVVPIGIDVPILVFTGAMLIFKRRGRTAMTRFAGFVVFFVTSISCVLNYLVHVDQVSDTPLGQAALIVGTLAPLLIWANVEALSALVTKAAPAPRQTASKAKPKRKAPARRSTPKVAAVEAPTEGAIHAA